jgi:hypothetical protein
VVGSWVIGLPDVETQREQQPAVNAVVSRRRETLMRCKTRTIGVRLDCLKSNLNRGGLAPIGSTSESGATVCEG